MSKSSANANGSRASAPPLFEQGSENKTVDSETEVTGLIRKIVCDPEYPEFVKSVSECGRFVPSGSCAHCMGRADADISGHKCFGTGSSPDPRTVTKDCLSWVRKHEQAVLEHWKWYHTIVKRSDCVPYTTKWSFAKEQAVLRRLGWGN